MKNYLDEIYTVSEFIHDNPALAEQAERAMQYLKSYCQNSNDVTYVIIEVEGYKCVAYLIDEFFINSSVTAPMRFMAKTAKEKKLQSNLPATAK